LIISVILGPVISGLNPLLSQESDWLTVLYELFYPQPQGYAPLGAMSYLFMEITMRTSDISAFGGVKL